MKTLYLVRGVSGSGKSTLASELVKYLPNSFEISADEFFTDSEGRYNFDASQLAKAHAWCRAAARDILFHSDTKNLIVHNTFTTEKELEPYIEMANLCSARIVCLVVENRHGNMSVHDVPEETLLAQVRRLKASIKLWR
ncbi:hypothetical protein [Vibrio phage JSF12]|uniref:3'-phosphatase, 5'-polynucleotide kinase n=2 Tax=Jesfedecavirus TaxID=2560156 RepID=A0A2D0YNM6_9CAUD|nr:ATPase [Vibrio phage JSF10]YP_009794751.1 ATPase [Vibrio phage JSF12]ASV43512.1 hypothetical protein [Vibrio phage JSF10]ASV43586.1 hypothetical protein [Vibrio phage JSF12]